MALNKFLKAVAKVEEQLKQKSEKRLDEPAHDESNWLVSYADMMTLLCVFFVLMFSMAKLDEGKYEALQAEIAKQFGNDYKSPAKEAALFISQVFKEAGSDQDIMIKSDPTGVMVTFESMILFDSMSADIRAEGRAVMNRLITATKEQEKLQSKQFKIVVEGHTDSLPVTSGPYPTNWELSAARAGAVVRMFVDNGFQPDHLTAVGYGSTRPAAVERTPAGSMDSGAIAKNRRVVIRLMEPRVDSIPFPESAKLVTPPANPAPSAH